VGGKGTALPSELIAGRPCEAGRAGAGDCRRWFAMEWLVKNSAARSRVYCDPPVPLGTEEVDGIKVRMPLDKPIECCIRNARGIEARSFLARAVGTAAA
jgi:hypothetical protein